MFGKQILPRRSPFPSASSSSTILYHDVAAGKVCHSTQFAVPMGWHCSLSPEPPTLVFCRSSRLAHNTLVSLHISRLHISLSCANGCSHSPLSQHGTQRHTNILQKPLAKPSLRHQTHLSHLHITVQEEKSVYLCVFVLQVIAHSKRCSLGCRRTSEQAEVPLPWQRGARCCCLHKQSQTRP